MIEKLLFPLCPITTAMKLKLDWFWGCIGFLGILGYLLKEPIYYVFFVFFLFFLVPVVNKSKNK